MAKKQRVCRIQEGTGEPCSLGLELTDEMETSGGAQVQPSVMLEEAGYMGHFISQIKYLIYNMSLAHVDGSVCILGNTRPSGHSHGMTKVTRSKDLEALKTSEVANSASSF